MKRIRLIPLSAICAILLTLLVSPQPTSAQPPGPPHPPPPHQPPPAAIYNPYPSGILPADLDSEITRVQAEVDFIEGRAFAQWQALPPPVLTGQPPVLQNTGTAAVETLGELMLFDQNMSVQKNQACGFCHMPYAGFSGPIPSVNLTVVAYPGSIHYRERVRLPQRHTYAPFFPVLQYNQEQQLFFGGNLFDSRATGYLTRNPSSQQAEEPPVDPNEMGFPDTACVAYRLQQAAYRSLFEEVWGNGSLDINFPHDTEEICSTPEGAAVFGSNTTPIELSPTDRTHANDVYDDWGHSVGAYEQSEQVSNFTSKFDAFLKGNYTMSADEMAGFQLFNGKGNCNSCHVDGRGTTLQPSQVDTSTNATANPPVFTCFGSANEGLPLNPRIPFYYEDTPDAYGFTPNPYGFAFRDLGMGTFLRSGFGSAPNPNSNWTQYAPMVDGQFQVATVRNAAMTPPQCPTTEAGQTDAHGNPIPYFQKEFFHNGYIKSLKQLVHFYNTRDTSFAYPVTSGHCPAGTIERVTCWPMKEVPNNLDTTTGMLGLTDTEENQIVAFLETLTDGYTAPYPNSDTFTGKCMTCNPATDPNCSASTQGNGELIPTPPLPPCASAICGVAPLPSPPIQ
jgi:cytochrome c peroxidase